MSWVEAGLPQNKRWLLSVALLWMAASGLSVGCKAKKNESSTSPDLAESSKPSLSASAKKDASTKPQTWLRLEIKGKDAVVPFIATYENNTFNIHNGASVIELPGELTQSKARFEFPILGVVVDLQRDGETLQGTWQSSVGGWPDLDVEGEIVKSVSSPELFPKTEAAEASFEGTWHLELEAWGQALARFKQSKDGLITGSILPAEFGDARYLSGRVSGNQAQLTTFDGNHAFLVTMTLDAMGQVEGIWHYLNYGPQSFSGQREEEETPATLTTIAMKKGKTKITLPAANSLEGEPVMIDFFGTWCPVCMDLTPFLNELYLENREQGLKVVSIAWEFDDTEVVEKRLKAYRQKYNVDWPIEIRNASNLADVIPPEIKNADGFPITMFLRRDGTVAGLHTGFVSEAMPEEREASKTVLRQYMADIMSSPASPKTKKQKQTP